MDVAKIDLDIVMFHCYLHVASVYLDVAAILFFINEWLITFLAFFYIAINNYLYYRYIFSMLQMFF